MQLQTALPLRLAEFIRQAAKTKTEESRLTRLARYILGKYRYNQIPLEEPIEISAEHFRRQFDTQYIKELSIFRNAGVIVSSNTYTVGKRSAQGERLTLGKCKTHYFAPHFVFGDPEIVSFSEAARARFEMNDPVIRATVPLLARLKLTLSETELKRYVCDFVTRDYIRSRCRVNDEIAQGYHYLKNDKIPKDLALLRLSAERSGLDVIQYREKCYLAPLDQFIERRVYDTRANYLDALLRIKESRKRPAIYCARNDRNRRLDTNLTNLKNELLELIRLDGERLVSIDLKNSQPLLLTHLIEQSFEYVNAQNDKNILEKNVMRRASNDYVPLITEYIYLRENTNKLLTLREIISIINVTKFSQKSAKNGHITYSLPGDLREFCELTKNGKFYERFALLLGSEGKKIYTRNEAKKILFLTLFSAHRYNPEEKKLLAKYYPSLVIWTNEFKRLSIAYNAGEGKTGAEIRERGNAQLAVILQTIESGIFIDRILARLLSEGFRVFTKHDSVLCKESDLSKVSDIVIQELDQALGAGAYQIKIEATTENTGKERKALTSGENGLIS
jgi:hypothetical protein